MLPEGSNWTKKLLVYGTTLVLLLVFLVAGYSLWSNKDYVLGRLGVGPKISAKVAGETISLETSQELAKDCGINTKQATELLMDEKVLTTWAADESVVISKNIQQEEEIRISGKLAANRCVSLQARVNLLREKLYQNIEKFREGKLIVVNFDIYNPEPFLKPPGVKTEADRIRLLKRDRTYADKLILSVNSSLKSGKLSFEEAIARVRKDPKVGSNSPYASSFQSGAFSASDYIDQMGLLHFDRVRSEVDALSEGKVSEPFIQQVRTGAAETGKLVDARWIIAKIERIGQGTGGSPKDLLKKTREAYGAVIYP